MLERVECYVQRHGLAGQNDRLLVGVSGGADSIALLLMLLELAKTHGFTLFAAHLNHGFRGTESDEDSHFVANLCLRLGIECECGFISVPRLLTEQRASPQEVARQARFRFFQEVMARHALNKLALAHHRDDQAETVLLRIIRGTGIRGLKGMSPSEQGLYGIRIVRPLLEVSRVEIEAYLATKGQPFRTDSSNRGTDYRRNFVRHALLPNISQINAEATTAINRLAEQAAIAEDYLETQVALVADQVFETTPLGVGVKLTALADLHRAILLRLLFKAYCQAAGSEQDLEMVHILDVEALIGKQPGRRADLPHGIRALRTREHVLFFHAQGNEAQAYEVTLSLPGEHILPCGGFLTAHYVERWPIDFALGDNFVAYLSFAENTITVRNRRPHDSYIQLGANGHKSLKKAMSEAGIPLPWRASWPIIEHMGEIIWVPGLRVAHRMRAQPNNPVLRLTYRRGGD